MPISFHVFVRRERIPTAAAWAQAIRDYGFATQLDSSFDPLSFSGYLPCPDERTGFELYLDYFSKASIELGDTAVTVVGDRDTLITFRLSGRETDVAAATAAAATLAAMSDGILLDDELGHFIESDAAIAWARDEDYRPIATRRRRPGRRRSRIRRSTLLRLAILLAAIGCILFLWH